MISELTFGLLEHCVLIPVYLQHSFCTPGGICVASWQRGDNPSKECRVRDEDKLQGGLKRKMMPGTEGGDLV